MFRSATLAIFVAACAHAPAGSSVPFEAGSEGYHTFRIPALVRAQDGTLLAFCEGRKDSRCDHGDIDIVMKRSPDQGMTWSELAVLQDDGGDAPITMGNPVPVLDERNGRLHLVFCRNNSTVFHSWSDDHGKSWSPRVEITEGLRKEGWGWYATGPCHGIQLKQGAQAGRLVIPANHRIGKMGDDSGSLGAHVIFSDDGGESWKMGALAGETDGIHPNETTAVELAPAAEGGSRIYFNTRNQQGPNPAGRAHTFSNDGGETFTSPYQPVADLETPVVQGSVFRFAGRLHFTCPQGKKRENLTLWSSPDEGGSWKPERTVFAGPSAYADMVETGDGKLGILFENGVESPYERITFVRVEIR